MSADNWRFCPQCSETEEQIIAEARKQYGKIPEDDYMQLLADARERAANRKLTLMGVAMAGSEIVDPYKD